jgi:hypothetical protein
MFVEIVLVPFNIVLHFRLIRRFAFNFSLIYIYIYIYVTYIIPQLILNFFRTRISETDERFSHCLYRLHIMDWYNA